MRPTLRPSRTNGAIGAAAAALLNINPKSVPLSYWLAAARECYEESGVMLGLQNGAALAGCSAGAMMMGSVTAAPRSGGLHNGLGLFHRLCVIPHFDRIDRFRSGMTDQVLDAVPVGTVVVGVDEHTGLVHDGAAWTVRGQQTVWVFESDERTNYEPGETVPLELRFGA